MNENNNEPVISDTEMKMPEDYTSTKNDDASHLGAVLAFLIVVLILLLGGLYLWGTTLTSDLAPAPMAERPTDEENNEPESTKAEAEVETQQALSTSDSLEALEGDLDGTDVENLDTELNAIESELNAM